MGGRADQLDRAVVVLGHVLAARWERSLHDAVFAGAGREHELADLAEQGGDRAVRAEIAAVLGERMAHFGHGARAVVGEAVDHDRGAARPIAFIARLVVGHAVELTRAALDRALHAVLGHVGLARLAHRQAQPRVGIRIAAAEPRRDRNLLDESREDLALFRIRGGFAVLDVRPFAVPRHSMILRTWIGPGAWHSR